MRYHDAIIAQVAEEACQRVSSSVIRKLRRMNDGMQSGGDSPLKNIWDEVCVQMQDEPSVMWEAYEDTLLGLIESELEKQCNLISGAIWLQTEEGQDWDWDNQLAADDGLIGQSRRNDEREFYFIEIEKQPGSRPAEAQAGAAQIPETVEYNPETVGRYIMEQYILRSAREWSNRRIRKYLDQGEGF